MILVAAMGVLSLSSIQHKSPTRDEPRHLRYGKQILNGDSSRFDDSKMPFTALNAIPGRIAAASDSQWLKNLLGHLSAARAVTVVAMMILALIVYRWSRELYGPLAGLVALFLCVFDPNLLAHGRLVTTDLYAALMVTLTFYTLWKWRREGTWRWGLAFALAIATAQLAKYSCILLYPFAAVLMGTSSSVGSESSRDVSVVRKVRATARWWVATGVLVITASGLAVNAGFLFQGTGERLQSYRFRSEEFKTVQVSGLLPDWVRVPVPHAYLEGLDWIRHRERTGKGFGRNYLLGELRRGQGFPSYYGVAFLVKVPIACQILFVTALVVWWTRSRSSFFFDEAFLLVPIGLTFIYLSFFLRAQLGIRYLIVVFPLVHVFTSGLWRWLDTDRLRIRWALGAFLAYQAISVLSYYPHFLPYFNEFVLDRTRAYKVLSDSNIDWGQDRDLVDQIVLNHPDMNLNPDGPTAGRVVVGVTSLTGVVDKERYRWLREGFEPVDHVAYSHLVFDIDPDALKRVSQGR